MLFPLDQMKISLYGIFGRKENEHWHIHRHNAFAALWYILKGEFLLMANGIETHVQAGRLVLIPPNTSFQAKINKPHNILRIIVIRLDVNIENNLPFLSLYRIPILPERDEDKFNRKFFLKLWREYLDPTDYRILTCTSMLQLLFCSIIQHNRGQIEPVHSELHSYYFKISKLIQWMGKHMEESVTRTQLAEMIHVTPDHLTVLFKKTTGMPPLQYLNQIRIDRAKLLLLSSDSSIGEIAGMTGIADPLYFSRAFKKATGISPSQFRRKIGDF